MNALKDSLVLLVLFVYTATYYAMSKETEHDTLTRAAIAVRATSSQIKGAVSRHVLPETIAFSALQTLHQAAKNIANKSSNDFLTALHDELIYSYADSYEKENRVKRKGEMGVEEEVDGLMRSLPDAVDVVSRTKAREVVVRLLRDLKGTQHERLVQSVLVSHQKLHSTDACPRLVIAARMLSGVPIPVGKLKGVLGDCWTDGAITIDEGAELLSLLKLPVAEEGILARTLGHRALRLVTAVPV